MNGLRAVWWSSRLPQGRLDMMERCAAPWAGCEGQRRSISRTLEDPRTGRTCSWRRPLGQLLAMAISLYDMSKPAHRACPDSVSAERGPLTQDPGADWDGVEQDARAG